MELFTSTGVLRWWAFSNICFLETLFSCFQVWADQYYTWNDTFPYNCVDNIAVRQLPLWTPDYFLLTNSVDSLHDSTSFYPTIYSNGSVWSYPNGIFSSNCEVDLTLFPFDRQVGIVFTFVMAPQVTLDFPGLLHSD